MTLDELKKEEEAAYSGWMCYEAAGRGYDFEGVREARERYFAAAQARKEAEALIAAADDDSILGLVRQIQHLGDTL